MNRPRYSTLQIWAFRDILRRPIESVLPAAALTATIAIAGTLLLFPRAVHDTLDRLLTATPAIIVRRVDAVGWQPLPVQEAVQAAQSVIGVVSVKPRIWGSVNGPDGPLTVIGIAPGGIPESYKAHLTRLSDPGQAVVGPGVAASQKAAHLELAGAIRKTYRVIGRLPDETGIFTRDLCYALPTGGGDSRLVLNNLNATFPAGRMSIICGGVGAGKSTLIHVLWPGSSAKGTMSPKSKVVFVDVQEASAFIAVHGGKMTSFRTALDIAQADVSGENAILVKRRLKMGKIVEPQADDRCAVCEMFPARYPQNKCQIHAAGENVYHFCSTQCMFAFLENPASYAKSAVKPLLIFAPISEKTA